MSINNVSGLTGAYIAPTTTTVSEATSEKAAFTSSEATTDGVSFSSSGSSVTPENIEEQKKELEKLKKEIQEIKEEKEKLETRKAQIKKEIDAANEQFDRYNKQIKLFSAIIEDEHAAVREEVEAAAAKYDPDVDGNYDSYIAKHTPDVSLTLSFYQSLITTNQTLADGSQQKIANLQNSLNVVNNNLNSVSLEAIGLNSKAAALENKITTCEKAMESAYAPDSLPNGALSQPEAVYKESDEEPTLAEGYAPVTEFSASSEAKETADVAEATTESVKTTTETTEAETTEAETTEAETTTETTETATDLTALFDLANPKVNTAMLNLIDAISTGSITLQELADFVNFETSSPYATVKVGDSSVTFDLADPQVAQTMKNLTNGISSGNIALDELAKFVEFETFKGASEVKDTTEVGELKDTTDLDKAEDATDVDKVKEVEEVEEVDKVEEVEEVEEVDKVEEVEEVEEVEPAATLAAELLSQISQEEKDIITEMGVDLTEKLSDGTPKYFMALAADGKYHIYEDINSPTNPQKGRWSSSLVRTYYEQKGNRYSKESYSVIQSGSGDVAPMNGRGTENKIYNFTSIGDDLTSGKVEEQSKTYYTYSPLNFDLEGDGIKTSNEIINFDIDGDGVMDRINNSNDAVLVFDADGDGILGEDGKELFGNNTDLDGDGVADGYKDGFEALKAIAGKAGLINGKDDNKLDENDLKQLEEQYGLKIKVGGYDGEAKSFFEVGISEINLSEFDETTLVKDFDGMQNDIMTQDGATFKINGETREYADLWHSKKDDNNNPFGEF